VTEPAPASAPSVPADWWRPLGRTGLWVSAVCAGGGPLGSMPDNFGYAVPEGRGIDTVRRVLAGPVTFLDTSNGYSGGDSERRIGAAMREVGGLPPGFVLATKVDRDTTGDFSGARVRRSLDESLQRLGLDRVQLLYLHDPEHISFAAGVAPGGPVEELRRIREEGLVGHLGVAGGPVDLMRRYLGTGVFDVLLTHNRYTLVDRSADGLIDAAHTAGIAVVNAAVYGGGILARGTDGSSRYAYRPAPPEVLAAVRAMERICARYGVPLAAAALRFSLRDERIGSTVVGVSRPERMDECVHYATTEVPDDLWTELDELVPDTKHWLDRRQDEHEH
jgi:D-threo-aldose 1-dehydrogenase